MSRPLQCGALAVISAQLKAHVAHVFVERNKMPCLCMMTKISNMQFVEVEDQAMNDLRDSAGASFSEPRLEHEFVQVFPLELLFPDAERGSISLPGRCANCNFAMH